MGVLVVNGVSMSVTTTTDRATHFKGSPGG